MISYSAKTPHLNWSSSGKGFPSPHLPFSGRWLRSGQCFVLLACAADVFFCTSLLCQFLVSTRARHPRSLASSRLTATFWSSSTSRLVCSCSSILWEFTATWLLVVTPALLYSTLQRRSRWTCASAVVYQNLVC